MKIDRAAGPSGNRPHVLGVSTRMTGKRLILPAPAGLLLAAILTLSSPAANLAQELPQTAPAPALRDPGTAPNEPAAPVPLPEPRPRRSEEPGEPQPAAPDGPAAPPGAPDADAPPPAPPDPRSAMRPDPTGTMPAPETECRRRLAALGAAFEEHAAESDPAAGCSMPYPLMLRSFGRGIALEPAAEMSCAMAEASARFIQEVATPAAQAAFGKGLKSVSQASAYVCRPRHGRGKLSEHAFGNALDIAAFTLADGARVAVELRPEAEAAIFLGRLRKAACGPFSTVLGPGSDADHATHLHFDLQPRRSGGSFCQ
jgi:hypothetical protein